MSSQYYVQPENLKNGFFSLDERESAHASRVMRLRIGDKIRLFDGEGRKYEAVIEETGKIVIGKIAAELAPENPPKLKLTLCFAPGDRKACEDIVDKCTQLGVAVFQPVITERTQGGRKVDSAKWRTVSIQSCKQCERARLPEFLAPLDFKEAFSDGKPAVLAWENAAGSPLPPAGRTGKLKLFIGPEGGFTDGEVEFAVKSGAETVSLGKNVLRAETAAIAACAFILL